MKTLFILVLTVLISIQSFSNVMVKSYSKIRNVNEVINFTCNQLGIDSVSIIIEYENIKDAAICEKVNDSTYHIALNTDLYEYEEIETIIHEVYHVFQYRYKGLYKVNGLVYYKGIEYTNDIPYLRRLYEKESINFTSTFIKEYFKYKRLFKK